VKTWQMVTIRAALGVVGGACALVCLSTGGLLASTAAAKSQSRPRVSWTLPATVNAGAGLPYTWKSTANRHQQPSRFAAPTGN
jgi:hypothetical protein